MKKPFSRSVLFLSGLLYIKWFIKAMVQSVVIHMVRTALYLVTLNYDLYVILASARFLLRPFPDLISFLICRSAAQRPIVHSPRRGKRPYMDQAGLDAIQNIPGKEALVMWEQVSALSKKRGLGNCSTFHD